MIESGELPVGGEEGHLEPPGEIEGEEERRDAQWQDKRREEVLAEGMPDPREAERPTSQPRMPHGRGERGMTPALRLPRQIDPSRPETPFNPFKSFPQAMEMAWSLLKG
jgi:hypothetical protein